MTVCLDTDVLVDCLRGLREAQIWLQSKTGEKFVVPGVVAMELLMGCQNQSDLTRRRRFSVPFTSRGLKRTSLLMPIICLRLTV